MGCLGWIYNQSLKHKGKFPLTFGPLRFKATSWYRGNVPTQGGPLKI